MRHRSNMGMSRFSPVIAVLVLAASRAQAYGNPRDIQMVEMLIKMSETRLASRPGYSSLEQGSRYGTLLDFIRSSGVGIPGSASARPLPPNELARALTRGLQPEEIRRQISSLRAALDSNSSSNVPGPGGQDPIRRGPGSTAPLQGPGSAVAAYGNAAHSYVLGPTDVVELIFLDAEIAPGGKINEAFAYTINLEGKTVLPLLGVVHCAGYTVAQLRDQLTQQYKRFIQNPRLTVFVKQYNSQRVYVMGENGEAKIVNLTGQRMTLFDLLTQIGGYGEAGDAEHILVFRGRQRLVINFKEHLRDPLIAAEFMMQPGDRVVIPRPTSKVTVLGGVKKAGEYPYVEGLTLLKVIASAESFSESARRERIKIIRKVTADSSQGNRRTVNLAQTETININALDILKGKISDVPLSPHDTVYVDEW